MTETTTAEDFGAPVQINDLIRELLPNHPYARSALFTVLKDNGYETNLPPVGKFDYVGAITELPAADAAHIRDAWPALVAVSNAMCAARSRRINNDPGVVQSSRFD